MTLKLFNLVRSFFGLAIPSVQLSKHAANFENRLRETILPWPIYIDIVEITVNAI